MNRIIVQVYEIQTPAEAERLVEMGVDHIGSVVLSQETWRVPEIKETIDLVRKTPGRSTLIPLFSDVDVISRALDYYRPDIVHFCEALTALDKGGKNHEWSDEDARRCGRIVANQENIKNKFPEIKTMRSVPIPVSGAAGDGKTVAELSKLFEPVSDYFLTDTLILNPVQHSAGETAEELQPVKGFVGITGKTCDWEIASRLIRSSSIPVVLAGGLSPENVYASIVQMSPAGVDTCTCTNAVDASGKPIRFKKDLEKVRRFVEAVRLAERAE